MWDGRQFRDRRRQRLSASVGNRGRAGIWLASERRIDRCGPGRRFEPRSQRFFVGWGGSLRSGELFDLFAVAFFAFGERRQWLGDRCGS